MIFQFTPYDLEDAREHDEKMYKLRQNAKTHFRCKKGTEIIGFLGELAFGRYLKWLDVTHKQTEIHQHSYGDKYDFWLQEPMLFGSRFIDVKATTRYDTIVLNERQAEKAKNSENELVLAIIDKNYRFAQLAGHASPSMLRRAPHRDFTWDGKKIIMYEIPKEFLKPMPSREIY